MGGCDTIHCFAKGIFSRPGVNSGVRFQVKPDGLRFAENVVFLFQNGSKGDEFDSHNQLLKTQHIGFGNSSMIADSSRRDDKLRSRIVITGIGVAAPNGNSFDELRESLLAGKSGVSPYEIRYFGKTLAGICDFDARRYQARRDIRRGTRAGSVGVYCAHEALKHAGHLSLIHI